jgi:hypothetical protein
VRNFFEVVCLVRKVNGIKSVNDMKNMPELIPIYTKLGSRSGTLNQDVALSASEQYILDPAKVLSDELINRIWLLCLIL